MPTFAERFNRWRFQRAVRAMLSTPPVPPGRHDFAALSMVHRRDVLPYLLAIKTFAHYAAPRRIVLVADPSLQPDDRALLRSHVPALEIVDAESYRRPALPVGGTWERLSAIAELNAETSVVQLDADTVTFGEPTEVVEAATAGRSFVIRSEAGVEIVSLEQAAATGRALLAGSRHVQVAAEARMDELTDLGGLRYARGCSGFSGFGRGALTPLRLAEVSARMRALHGARWDEWGTEQVTSNLLAASADGAMMLPHPRYCNADSMDRSSVLAHYIGYARFTSRHYEQSCSSAASLLVAQPAASLQQVPLR
jgi:hypothetical protein